MRTLADRIERHGFADPLISQSQPNQKETQPMSIYDELATDSEFISWKNVKPGGPGSKYEDMDITDVRKGKDFNGGACPELALRNDQGDDLILTCGQAQLKHLIMELRPDVGDRIDRIELVRLEKAEKGQKKVFEVDLTSGGAKGTAASAAGADEDPF